MARATLLRGVGLVLLLKYSNGQIDDEMDDSSTGMGAVGMTSQDSPSCKFTAKGSTFNLEGMTRTEHDFTGTTPGGYTYRFNVCGGTVKVCNQQQAPSSKWRGTKCNNLGDLSTQEIGLLDNLNPHKGLKVSYHDGDICKKQVPMPNGFAPQAPFHHECCTSAACLPTLSLSSD